MLYETISSSNSDAYSDCKKIKMRKDVDHNFIENIIQIRKRTEIT